MASKKKAGKAAAAKTGAGKKGASAKEPLYISDEEALRRLLACGFNGAPGTAAMLLRLDALADIARSFGKAEKLARSRAGGRLSPAAQVRINPVSRDAQGRVSPTGELRGLAIDARRPRRAYGDAFRALESRKLCRCDWLKEDDLLMPTTAFAPAGAISEIGELRGMAADLAERLRAREAATSKPKPAPPARQAPQKRAGEKKVSQPAAPNTAAQGPTKAAKAPVEAGKALEGAKALEEYSRSAADGRLGRWAARAAGALRDGTADDELKRELRAGKAPGLAALLTAREAIGSGKVEERCLSAIALENSKSLEHGYRGILVKALVESGRSAKPRARTSEVLADWGVISSSSAGVKLAGDFSLETASGALAPAAGAHATIEVDDLGDIRGADPRDVRAVVVVENLAAWRAISAELGDLACFAYFNGAWGEREIEILGRLRDALGGGRPAPLLLWFDIDPGGFQRASAFMGRFPDSRPVLMGAEDFRALPETSRYRLSDGSLRTGYSGPGKGDADAFAAVSALCADLGRGIEQEAMLAGYAQARLRETLQGMPKLMRPEDPRGGASGEAEKHARKGFFGATAGGAMALGCGAISVFAAAVSVAAAARALARRP